MLDRLASRPIGTEVRARLQGASWLEEGFLRVDRDRTARVATHTVLPQWTRRTHDGEMKGPTAFLALPQVLGGLLGRAGPGLRREIRNCVLRKYP